MIRIIEEDILNATEDIIGHQVNCMGVMGAGLAKQIKIKWPLTYQSYISMCKKATDARNLLGEIQVTSYMDGERMRYIVNIFGQYGYGRGKQQTDYDALYKALMHLKRQAKKANKSIALPYGIGCGLAGGDWSYVQQMIENIFEDYEVALYKLP